jgi:uncharacterized paraquat-inducible protein A
MRKLARRLHRIASTSGTAAGLNRRIMADNETLAARAERAEQIKRKPDLYKVCEGCESIVVAEAATCPNCHGYRFDLSTVRVREQADILGKRLPTSVPPSELM